SASSGQRSAVSFQLSAVSGQRSAFSDSVMKEKNWLRSDIFSFPYNLRRTGAQRITEEQENIPLHC
ncbi:MAG: hypothetical protein RBR39_09095, partial [Proteiniphilum sp.]|nr:hypothetical protein [Proteiniphilum sp.]